MKRPFTRGRRSATCLRHSYRTVFENERLARLLRNLIRAFSRSCRRSSLSSGSSSAGFFWAEKDGEGDAECDNESTVEVESAWLVPALCLDVGVADVQAERLGETSAEYPELIDNSIASRRTHASAIMPRLNDMPDSIPPPSPPCRRTPFRSSYAVLDFLPRQLAQSFPLGITTQQLEHHDVAILQFFFSFVISKLSDKGFTKTPLQE